MKTKTKYSEQLLLCWFWDLHVCIVQILASELWHHEVLYVDDEGSTFLRNVYICPQDYVISHPGRSQPEFLVYSPYTEFRPNPSDQVRD